MHDPDGKLLTGGARQVVTETGSFCQLATSWEDTRAVSFQAFHEIYFFQMEPGDETTGNQAAS